MHMYHTRMLHCCASLKNEVTMTLLLIWFLFPDKNSPEWPLHANQFDNLRWMWNQPSHLEIFLVGWELHAEFHFQIQCKSLILLKNASLFTWCSLKVAACCKNRCIMLKVIWLWRLVTLLWDRATMKPSGHTLRHSVALINLNASVFWKKLFRLWIIRIVRTI